MKINMETAYIPCANIYQIRDMMDSWRTTGVRCKTFSYICGCFALFTGGVFLFDKEDSWWIQILCSILFLAGGYLSSNWKYTGFVSVMSAVFLEFFALSLPLPDENWKVGCLVALAFMVLVPFFYSYKLMYNYKNIFKELEKLNGFPNFIVNTADLYADKMYLKDKKAKDKTLYDSKTEVSYNPFSTEDEIKAESVKRQQEYKSEKVPDRLEKNITVTSVDGVAPQKTKKTYKYGKKIFGRYIIFPHNAWRNDEFEEKKDWMGYWRMNAEYTAARFPEMIMFLFINGMIAPLVGANMIPFLILMLVFLLGTNQMKMGKWYGAVITLIGVIIGFVINLNNVETFSIDELGCFFIYLCAMGVNNGIIFGTIRFLLNYRTHKELSKMEAYPTFVRTTADLYGDKMYIVEKPKPIVKSDPSQRKVKVMNIGVEPEKKKADDGAWNAFNYMDEAEEKGD